MASENQVVIYTKPGCCLCDRAREQLSALQKRHSFDLRDVNILKDAEAYEKFKDEIPVIFVNGHEAFKYRLDVNAFLKLIRS
ncbi:MAG: glutaredoxin family protein [Acidobacteriota bacterium]|nr:glutaredoxin family protein [Acidobacteriota bacterium]